LVYSEQGHRHCERSTEDREERVLGVIFIEDQSLSHYKLGHFEKDHVTFGRQRGT
jgi:hypothetical protein